MSITDEQFHELRSDISRLSARSIPVPKRNGPDWTKIVGAVIAIGTVIGAIAVGFIVQTKADAATQHTVIKEKATETYETKEHAKETHDRHETSLGKIDALYQHVIEQKPRSSVRVPKGG